MTKEKKNNFRKETYNWFNREKQRAITYLCYAGIVALSILTSTLSLIFGLEHFDFTRFITNLCFNIAFAILALVLSWKDGELGNEQRKKGDLFDIKQKFDIVVKLIVDTMAFRQWNDKLYEQEKRDYILTELTNANINDEEYLYISQEDLDSLVKEPREDVYYYDKKEKKQKLIALDQITNYQKAVIEKFRKGKFVFQKLPYTFFKTKNDGNSYKRFADEGDRTKKIKVLSLLYRVGMILTFSTILSLAIINPNESDAKQVVFDTVSRVFNMVSSMFMGYSLARDEAKRTIESLDFKIKTITDFNNELKTGIFVPLNRDELIQKKIKEIREQKEQEVLKELIKVEIVEETKPQEPEIVEIEMSVEEAQERGLIKNEKQESLENNR